LIRPIVSVPRVGMCRRAGRFLRFLPPMIAALSATAAPASAAKASARPAKAAASEAAPPAAEDAAAAMPSEAAARVADWVAASGDNGSAPYIILDKNAAALFLFDAKGKPIGQAPVLIGVAPGDDATPGVGSKSLAEIGPAERTTPAGRFLAKFGVAAGRQKVLWVDYATSVAIHPIPKGNSKERRRQRLLSKTAEDNRITFGCINVPLAFYTKSVRPAFRKGGLVYILPDTKPIETVFPRLRVQPYLSAAQAPTAQDGASGAE
jgi:hypothetical protein